METGDNGAMSAWYILSAMGTHQLVPGSTTYVLGSPLYRVISIDAVLDNGNLLAPNNQHDG